MFAALPFLTLVASNPGNSFPWSRMLVYWAIVVGLATLVVALLRRRNRTLTERLAAVIALAIYAFGQLAGDLDRTLDLPDILGLNGAIWTFAALVIAAMLVSRWKVTQSFVAVLGTLLLTTGVLSVVGGGDLISGGTARAATPDALELDAGNTPNVYWFILDGYGRGDVLEDHYGDTRQADFLQALKTRGFSVSSKAFAAYPMTYISVAATLAADYVAMEGDNIHEEDTFENLAQGGGWVLETFRSWGYSYLLWPGDGFNGTSCVGVEDTCLRPHSWVQEPERAILRMTPLASQIELTSSQEHFTRSDPIAVADAVLEVEENSPIFALIHLINPHPPHYQAGPECALQDVPFRLGAIYGVSEYVDSVRCLNSRLLKAVNRIVRSDEDAVIILQGDHGPSWSLAIHTDSLDKWNRRETVIRLGVLSAMRLPGGCAPPDTMSLPNTFRVVFDCLSTDDVPLLQNRTWIANQTPGDLREVDPID